MSEMEQLKENAEKSKLVQTLGDVSKYLDSLMEECSTRLKASFRADGLVLFTFFGYFAVLIVALFGNLDPVIRRLATELTFMVELVAIFRSWHFTKRWREKEGEWNGAVNVLRILGMVPPEQERGIKNKKKIFSEGIELVKRWFTQKKEAQEKMYAPA